MQYKFRGQLPNGQWVYGNHLQRIDSIGKLSLIEVQDQETFEIEVHHVKSETVGMWTGLKDKHGKEIFNGDILKSFSPSVPSYEVFYCKSSYRLRYKLKGGEWYDWGPLFRMEEIQWEGRLPLFPDVIGNIHDHPHLLNPAKGAVTNTMLDPNLKAAEAATEQATEGQTAALESAAQDKAMEATETPVNTDDEVGA